MRTPPSLLPLLSAFLTLALTGPALAQAPAAPQPVRVQVPHGLPRGAVMRLGPARVNHRVAVTGLAFSSDGQWLASGGGDGEVELWDAGTLRAVHHLRGLRGSEVRVAFSPDGKNVAGAATGGDPGVCLWDVATGKERWRGADATRALAFSPDGKWLACGFTTGAISLRDASTGKEVRQLQGHDAAVGHLAFLDGSRQLASVGRHDTLCLWDTASGKELRRVKDPTVTAEALGFSPDGNTLVAQPNVKEVLLSDVTTGKPGLHLHSKLDPDGTILGSSAAFSPDRKWLAVGNTSGILRLFDLSSGKEAAWIRPHTKRISALAFARDGRTLATGGWDGILYFWDLGGQAPGPLFGRQPASLDQLVFTRDGKRLVTSGHDDFCLWDVASGRALEVLPFGKVSPDGRWVARFQGENALGVSRLTGGKDTRLLPIAFSREGGDYDYVFSPDGKRLAWHDPSGGIRVLDMATGKELRRLPDQRPSVLSFSGDGKSLLVTRWNGTIQNVTLVWDLLTGKEVYRSPLQQSISVLSPNGQMLVDVLTSTDDKLPSKLVLRDLPSGKPRREVLIPAVSLSITTFAPDGSALAFVNGSMDHLFLMKLTARHALDIPVDQEKVGVLVFSPDGRALATYGRDGTLTLYETATGRPRQVFAAPGAPLGLLVFSPDGRYLASASRQATEDATVLLWDLRAPRPPVSGPLTKKALEGLWADLADADAVRGLRAMQVLANVRQAAALLGDRLQPMVVDRKRLAELVRDLDSKHFTVRSKATAELEKAGAAAAPLLRQALQKPASLEAQRRLKALLERCESARPLSGEELRQVRAIEALEYEGTARARQVLESLAGGAADARLTRDARAALGRLTGRPAP